MLCHAAWKVWWQACGRCRSTFTAWQMWMRTLRACSGGWPACLQLQSSATSCRYTFHCFCAFPHSKLACRYVTRARGSCLYKSTLDQIDVKSLLCCIDALAHIISVVSNDNQTSMFSNREAVVLSGTANMRPQLLTPEGHQPFGSVLHVATPNACLAASKLTTLC